MIQDIRLTGYDFLDKPLLPLSAGRQFHLFYVFDGSGVLIVDSSSYTCSRDSLFLFPSLEVAVPRPGSRSSLTILHMAFTCASPHMGGELSQLPKLLPFSPEQRGLVMEILHECLLKRPLYEDLCSLYLEQLLVPLAAAAYREKQAISHAPWIAKRPEGPLAEACAYIDRHLGEDLSSDTLCEACRVSSRQLNSLFRRTFHQSTMEYIGNRRLARARELLCFSRSSVTEIAERTGFKSVHYFSRVFKEKEGIPPGEYKKRIARSLTL